MRRRIKPRPMHVRASIHHSSCIASVACEAQRAHATPVHNMQHIIMRQDGWHGAAAGQWSGHPHRPTISVGCRAAHPGPSAHDIHRVGLLRSTSAGRHHGMTRQHREHATYGSCDHRGMQPDAYEPRRRHRTCSGRARGRAMPSSFVHRGATSSVVNE